jgi:hypothetical protein
MRYPERGNGAAERFPPKGQNWPSGPVRPNEAYGPRDPRSQLSRPEPAVNSEHHRPPRPPVSRREDNKPVNLNRTLVGFGLCIAALAIGFFALKISPVAKVGSYGLIDALSPLYYVAVVVLIISFALGLRAERHRSVLLGTHLVILVFLVQGAPSIIEGAARFETAYEHVGFVGYIANTGGLLQNFDARFSWPSFFEAMAMLDKVAGISSAEVFLRWWPVAMNLLYLPFIYGIAKQLLRSELRAWVAAGLFPLANWVGQDYFSPQSVAYLLYLAFIFILVVPLGARDRPAWQLLFSQRNKDYGTSRRPRPRQPEPRAVGFYLGAVVLLMAAIATGHQLTPFMAIITSVVLVVAGRTQVRGVVVVATLITIGWICYGAETFWSGHIDMMIGGLGNVGGNVSSGVSARLSGSAAHEFIVDSRLVTAVFVWGLALLGALVWRPRNGDRAVVLLMFLAAFGMIAGGNYGGEGVLRVYLFSLPGAVCLIAVLVTKLPRFWHGQVALCCTLLLLTPLFLLARWGNELYEMTRPDELTAINDLYRIATPGSNLVSVIPFIPWEYTGIIEFQYLSVDLNAPLGSQTLSQITAIVAGNPKGGYVIITKDEEEYGWLVVGLPENWGTTVENLLARSPNYKLRYANPDGEIFQYIPHPQVKKSSATKTTQTKNEK